MPNPEPSVLGHIIEGRVEQDPITGRYQVMTVGADGKAHVVDLQDLVAPYAGKDVRLTLASFENLDMLARMAEQAGGGMVSVKMNGQKQLLSIQIEADVFSGGDKDMLQDLIVAAVNEGIRKVDEAMQQQLGGLTGGLKIPGLF